MIIANEVVSSDQTNLIESEDGATVMEFGLVSVVFITMLMGMFDIGQTAYAQAVLNGAVQEAARTSTLETGNIDAADERIENLVRQVAPNGTVETTRVSYFDFADVAREEEWGPDLDGDGTCSDGESFVDENGNGQWDQDIGVDGNGQASDVVIYTVTLTYDPLFPIPFYDTPDAQRTLSAVAVKKNQPFAEQLEYGSAAGVC